MSKGLNRIRNPDFAKGTRTPRGWTWWARSNRARWRREPHREAESRRPFGVTVTIEGTSGTAYWSQVVVCQPDRFYRIEATVSCDLHSAASGTSDKEAPKRASLRGGFVLSVETMDEAGQAGEKRQTPPVVCSSMPLSIRTYYQTADGIRRLRVSAGIVRAGGTAQIHHVRMFEILEPEAESHVLAVPPPPHAMPAPHVAHTLCICSATAGVRPITGLLRAALGAREVRTCDPNDHGVPRLRTDAILLCDSQTPPWVSTIQELIALAEDRIVVVSLPAFAKLSRGAAAIQRIEQEDDPIHARITFATHATRGFALHDAFPHAWAERTPWSFVQNQFRATPEFERLCKRYGFVVQLDSLCNREATSYRPVCLFKKTPGGGLYVLDIEPIEAASSTFGESTTVLFWLLSLLGHNHSGLGQYVVPVRREAVFREQIRALVDRFPRLRLHEDYNAAGVAVAQVVSVRERFEDEGGEATRKPVILIRSGLTPGDVEAAYSALLWFKQLVRAGAHPCPYADALTSRFELIWAPYLTRWEAGDGWQCIDKSPRTAPPIPEASERIHAMIDLVSCLRNHCRVVIPRSTGRYARYRRWIPKLMAAMTPGRGFGLTADHSDSFADRNRQDWPRFAPTVEVAVEADAFSRQPYRRVLAEGGEVVRIEIPGVGSDFAAQSIFRTDLTATLLEWIVGLQYGLIVVNRTADRVRVADLPPLATGQCRAIPKKRLRG